MFDQNDIMWDEEDLAYAAGFLDGEGCFSIQTGQSHKISVSCSNTDPTVIRWLHETFGGSISKTTRKRKEHHRPIYAWQVVAQDAYKFCQVITPYLRMKSNQAMTLIALQQTKGLPLNGRKIKDGVLEERNRLDAMNKEMKRETYI